MEILLPPGWPRPRGYSNGIAAEGRMVFVAGQIGWDETQTLVSPDFLAQIRQALLNTVAVLNGAGAAPEHVVRMTWFVTDKEAFLRDPSGLGAVYREVMGKHFPAMSVVVVKELIEDGALIEIETTAVVPT
jgi:enamine deaminase RidA (YjgF/YER057c/UK114 family)